MSDNKPYDTLENWLRDLGANGTLDDSLTSSDVDTILNQSPSVTLSQNFRLRAMASIQNAQLKREQVKPILRLGSMIARARITTQLELDQIAAHVGMSLAELERFEAGNMSLKQFIRNLPPVRIHRLLNAVELNVQDFIEQLMNIASAENTSYSIARIGMATEADKEQLELLMKYIAELEQLGGFQ